MVSLYNLEFMHTTVITRVQIFNWITSSSATHYIIKDKLAIASATRNKFLTNVVPI